MKDPIAPIVSQFEQNPNAIRIQKLLIYVCRNHWESEICRFDTIHWRSLIEEVKSTHPTLEKLRSQLTQQIGTLNKSAEYALIGQIILSGFERLYVENESNRVADSKLSTKLEHDIHISRIKKLLIYTCRKYWEANSYVIEQTPVAALIDELLKQYPSAEELRSGLAKVVKTLNKTVEYSLIAEIIVREIAPLYGTSKPPARANLEKFEPIDLFDIRREILKFANPLQTKILLFSSAYYLFKFCPQDWSNLKLYSLDGLLRTVVLQAETIEELQHFLSSKAAQLSEPEPYLEIVPVLVRSLKQNYDSLRQQLKSTSRTGIADATTANSTRALL